MRKNPRARFLPLVVLPAILPATLLPMMSSHHLPDYVMGGTIGIFYGLSIAAFVWMFRGNSRCASSDAES